ncbi:MtrB/PioB family outer membrane beta-barrel protein [Dyella sedimenti]|uniref:MtrB/PioB family outer membrane beta-barrel protein n=1 Tax=Dyella sedimenti TaxID=2919947 RepID=UPI001FAA11BB|nr:MtrB/PioB family outer membrane beta-barrel protein [Dyella sedimenti]
MRAFNPISVAVLLGLCVGWSVVAAASDTSGTMRVGDMQYGNGLDPRGWTPLVDPDADGMSWLHAGTLRTPSGALYPYPNAPLGDKPLAPGSDWTYWGLLQLGYIHLNGDRNAEFFRQYTDWKNGAALGLLAVGLNNTKTGSYVEFRGSRISSDDQYYRLRAGRYGSYRVEAFYRDIPHTVSTAAYPLWNGVGGTNLTLPAGLTPGDSTVAAVQQASRDAARREIKLTRTRTGLSVEGGLYRNWVGFASITNEERNGDRLWGGPMFFNFAFPSTGSPYGGNGGVLETVRPIDFTTTDVNLGLRNVGKLWHFNALYTGSFFRDHKDYLNYQNPFLVSPVVGVPAAGLVTNGQFSLEPDNDYHNLRLELSRELTWRGELSLAAAYGTMRQDDDLLPPVNCTGTLGFSAGPLQQLIPCADWNTSAALSKTSANARIDTHLLDAKVSFHPTNAFAWHADLRYYQEDNKTRYLSYNPITGQYGYISENGSQGTVVPGEVGIFDNGYYNTSNVQIASIPFGYQDTLFELGTDWNPSRSNTLGLTYTYDHDQPKHRERSRLDEQRIKLTWSNRAVGRATLRASFEYGDRDGGKYNYDPYLAYYSASLPGYVPADGIAPTAFTVDAMRKYDMSDRKEAKAKLIVLYPLGETSTLTSTFYGTRDHYDAPVGRQNTSTTGFTASWDWQPGPQTTGSAYIGVESTHLKLANVADNEALVDEPGGENADLGGPFYPLENYWHDLDNERDYNAGITFAHDFGRVRLDLGWNYTQSLSKMNYDYASPGALTHPEAATPDGVGAFPNNHYRSSTFNAGLTFPVVRNVSVRLFGSYQSGSFLDWHYLGFDDTLVYDHRIYTDEGPQLHYSVTTLGVMLNVKL